MPKWKKGHTTPHVCVSITNPRRNIPSEHDQQARFRLQQSVLDSFHTEIQGPVFLSVGPGAKLDMFNNFDLDKPFDLHFSQIQFSQEKLDFICGCYIHHKPQFWILEAKM